MNLRVGCDVVSIKRLEKALRDGGDRFAEKIFTPSEFQGATLERLAGIFAAKEAACKALGIPSGNWKNLEVNHSADGAPLLKVHFPFSAPGPVSLSISHDGDTAFAVVVAELISSPLPHK